MSEYYFYIYFCFI